MVKPETGPLCPVFGFELDFEPWPDEDGSLEICPCCFIHFGYEDATGGDPQRRTEIYKERRQAWIATGMPFRDSASKPADWDPREQLRRVTEVGEGHNQP